MERRLAVRLYLHRRGRRAPFEVDLYDIETGARRPWKQILVDGIPDANGSCVSLPTAGCYVYSGTTVSSELYLVEGLR